MLSVRGEEGGPDGWKGRKRGEVCRTSRAEYKGSFSKSAAICHMGKGEVWKPLLILNE